MRYLKSIILCLLLAGMAAQVGATTRDEQREAAKASAQLMKQAEQFKRQHQYLESVHAAAMALSVYPENSSAQHLICRYYDQAVAAARDSVQAHPNQQSIEDTSIRMRIYQLLMETSDYIRTSDISLPAGSTIAASLNYWDGYYYDEQLLLRRLQRAEEERKAKMEEVIVTPID